MNVKAFLLFLLFPFSTMAQGYAGLGGSAEGFNVPQRGYEFEFPRDHGPHPEYRIEWWYLTANLIGADGKEYGIQWTLFRSALRPFESNGWQNPQLWMGHAAITTPDAHFFAERLSRGGIGQAGVESHPFEAWIDEWYMRGDDFDTLSLAASGTEFSYNLSMSATSPLIFHGDQGYSVKSTDGQASYYYSQPSFDVQGVLKLPSGDVPVKGEGWLDREWSSQPLSSDQIGWDWFSLSFDSGQKLMAFKLRGVQQDFTSATWIESDGHSEALPNGVMQFNPLKISQVAGRDVPTSWRLILPDRGLDIEVSAQTPNAWMGTRFEYWEGPVRVSGTHSGRGYLEMTGY
ncbi:lipocalin-like domain-containing protein [Ruegeria arenilitoris]|uniref:lipocalin-like domain-containing protein n=1 Tax=Ruegeria arenilitoris TaxID=1173585 RepID=UPI001480C877|nr:lipocalin-like domain-containing protein [Ruegeria arenilitoris]